MLRLDNLSFSWAIALSVLVLTSIARYHGKASKYKERSRGRPLPPGPTPLPIVGNLFDIPKVLPWHTYRDLSRKYGKIISLNTMGQCLVVINDIEVATELFEKRSAIYSSRPSSVIFDMCGWVDWNFLLLPYSPRWRSYRRTFWQHFHPGAIGRYCALQENGARRLLSRLLSSDSEKLIENIRYSLGELLFRAAYGLQTADVDDKYIATFEEVLAGVDLLLTGPTSILEFFPLLARVPAWLPGTSLLRRIAHYRELTIKFREVPWADAKEALAAGTAPDSMASALFEECSSTPGEDASAKEETIKNVLAVAYAAGIDTTHTALCAFFVAMSLYPDVQRKAQVELDAVVGQGRLPQLADRDKLPYVTAVVREVLRWHTVAPLGVPHVSVSDDEYNGYFIPKGSIVLANVWSMSHDEIKYDQPDCFIPDRFLQDGKIRSDILTPVFGFGRRICPARYFAEATLFIYVASVLHTLDITPPVDEQGHPIQIEVKASSGLIS